MAANPVVQAVLFSGTAAGVVLLTLWWLFRSPVRGAGPAGPPPRYLATWVPALVGAAVLVQVVGGLWDASMHIRTGVVPGGRDFLWPPHLLIYTGFALSLAVAVLALAAGAASAGPQGRDPRLWVRRFPQLGVVAVASLYALLAIPGDAIWHLVFGPDLTAWSPPHVLLALATAAQPVCAAALVAGSRPAQGLGPGRAAAVVALLAVALNAAFLVGTLEWELPVRPAHVLARPAWAYPTATGLLAVAGLALARHLTGWRWAATAVAAGFFALRWALTLALGAAGEVQPALPLPFLAGALLWDAGGSRPPGKETATGPRRGWRWQLQQVRAEAMGAAAFAAGFLPVAMGVMAWRDGVRLAGGALIAAVAIVAAGLACTLGVRRVVRGAAP